MDLGWRLAIGQRLCCSFLSSCPFPHFFFLICMLIHGVCIFSSLFFCVIDLFGRDMNGPNVFYFYFFSLCTDGVDGTMLEEKLYSIELCILFWELISFDQISPK